MYAGKLSNLAVPLPIRSFSTEVERARRERKRREGESPPASLAMEAVAIKLVAGLAKTAVVTALGSLVKLLKYERALEKSVKDGLRSLKAELMFMQDCIENVSSGPPDQINSVEMLWVSELRELSCTIDTRLHSFMSSIESAKDTLIFAATKRVINHRIASFIQDQMIKVKEVSERRGRYVGNTTSKTSSAHKVDPRLYGLYKKESELVGLAGAIEELTNMLSTCDHVSIVGMGGLGKTTLARAVYGKLEMKGEYDCCAFVEAGQNANVKKVLTDILHELRIEIYGSAPDERQLIDQLRTNLDGKRCLFVIDDIWANETWDLIKCAFVGTPESRVITTTRKLGVAKPVGGVYMMKRLSDAKSKELLHTAIFGAESISHDTEFGGLADKILSKCGGVPLAIVTIARLLATKPREEWSTVYDSIGFGDHVEDVGRDIRMIMYFSYYDLPYHLQRCFLYLSIFPEGHWIEKNMLIWKWVAEGLADDEERIGSFQRGETYFNELIDRSMIQWAVSPRDLGQGGCRVHAMMLDLILELSSSEKENFSTVIGKGQESTSQTSTIHRLAIHKISSDGSENTSPLPKQNPNIGLEVGDALSFYASTCPGSCMPPLSRFVRLRAIDLEDCDLSVGDRKLKHLAKMRELAYLGLSGTRVAELPEKIRRLKFLQTLDVTGTGMKELPQFVEELKKLRCLRAGKGTTMTGRVGELTSLEELWLHSADKSPDFAVELRKLTELRLLVIHLDNVVEGIQEELVESLSMLKKLQVLQVWFHTHRKVHLPCWDESVPFRKLRQLLLFGVIHTRLMPWIHYECVPQLTKLLLEVEVLEEQDMQKLGQMPSLCSLYLHSGGVSLPYTAGKGEFKVLEYLNTNVQLVCGDGALPSIQELEVAGIRVGTDVGLRGNMPLLERAIYHLDCWLSPPAEIEKAEATLIQESQAHPNKPTITIRRFHNVHLDQILMELPHQLRQHASKELSSVPGLTSARGNFYDHCDKLSEIIARNMTCFRPRPSLTMVNATAGTNFPSQFADGGVPPKIGEGRHVLLTSGSLSQEQALAESDVQISGADLLEIVNREFRADMVLDMRQKLVTSLENIAAVNETLKLDANLAKSDVQISSADLLEILSMESANMLPDMLQKLVMNPEIIAVVNKNFTSVANGSPSVSGFSALIQCVFKIISQQKEMFINLEKKMMQELNHKRIWSFAKQLLPQNAAPEFLESMERFLQNPEYVACLESWLNDPGFSGPSASYITHCWKLAEAHCTSSMAHKIDVAESGQDATCSDVPSSMCDENSAYICISSDCEPLAETQVDTDSSEHVERPSSTHLSDMFLDPAYVNLVAVLLATPGFRALRQDESGNIPMELKELLTNVEQVLSASASSGHPSSSQAPDNAGTEEGGAE